MFCFGFNICCCLYAELTPPPLQVSAVIVSVVGVALVAVYSDTKCTPHTLKDTNLIFNETQLVNTTTVAGGDEGVRGHMLGHVHRASSCKEQSTIPGYMVGGVGGYVVGEVRGICGG